MTKRVDEMQEPLVVGRFYSVPTVWFTLNSYGWRHWPVIGFRHADRDHLNFAEEHFHFDFRFFSDRLWAQFTDDWGGSSELLPSERAYGQVLPEFSHKTATNPALPERVTVHRRMRCHRQFPTSYVGRHKHFGALHAAYKGHSAICTEKGFVCPHRAAPLGTLVPNSDGIIQCPLHGLRFYAATGEPAYLTSKEIQASAGLSIAAESA